ncbi:MAG TPA: rod shape-determining protein MreC [Candidatus Paceibacterota bacterium]|nr:rod shape-determining protein MreC [Candidatus Paceibacterota bacterium]
METRFRSAAPSARIGRRRLFFVTLGALLVVLVNMASGGKLSAAARDIVAPVWGVGATIGNGIAQSGFFTSRSALEAQVAALQEELLQGQLQVAAFQVLQQENASLSQLTHLAQTSPGLAAPVTSSVISSPYGTFTVGAGRADGVAEGSLVLMQGGFVIGKVTQVQEHQSLVEQLFAPGVQTGVSIDGAQTVATGQGGEAQALLPRGVAVSQNDPVLAPGFGNRPVGIVQHVDSNPANAQAGISIALPVSFASLQYVYVTP